MANNEIESNFISFLEDIPNIIKEVEVEKEKLPPKFNLIGCLERHTDEVKNSLILKTMFEIKFTYKNEEISFAKLFIDYLNDKFISQNKIVYSDDIPSIVGKEIATDEGRRIDILIEIDKDNDIIIENKINAGDQDNQLNDYYKDRKKSKNVYVLYLTKYGEEPSENSLEEKYRDELGGKFICISHGDIGLWLEDILKKYSLIKTNEHYKFIYSALVQIIENEKSLSDMTKENNVEKEVVEKYVDKFIKGSKNIISTKEYAEVLKQASDILYHKCYFSFYEKLISCLDKKFKGIGSSKSHDDELHSIIERVFINKNIGYYKILYSNTNDTSISIFLQMNNRESIYGLLDGDGSRGGDRKEKYVKNINKLNIGELGYTRSSGYCSHYNIINEMTDKPEDIADKIYNLYKLLKNNGF